MITVLQDGEEADRGLINSTLQAMSDQGTTILAGLADGFSESLTQMQRRLSAINARRQRANRSQMLRTLARIETTDFQNIDQSKSTATIRVDAGSATLRERNVPQGLTLASTVF